MGAGGEVRGVQVPSDVNNLRRLPLGNNIVNGLPDLFYTDHFLIVEKDCRLLGRRSHRGGRLLLIWRFNRVCGVREIRRGLSQ